MIELRPYPGYRDSGVEWLGEVPEHWEVRRLKTLSRIRYGLGQPPKEAADGLALIRATNVSRGEIVEADMIYVDPSDVPAGRDALLSEGEIIVVRSGAYTADSAMIPKAYSGAVTGYDMVVNVTRALPEFIAFALRATYIRDDQLVVVSTRSAQPHLNAQELGDAFVLLPFLHEQTAIARFLDDTDRCIHRYIRAKERLIELLEEQKQAIIRQAVTGQIDVRTGRPYLACKDSGVEWLGEVPEHWEVCPLRRCVKICGGMTPSMDNRRFWDGEIPWVTPKDMKKDAINNSRLKVTGAALEHTSLKEVDPGAVLIVVRGMILARTVPVAWTTVPVTINQDMKALTPCPRVNAEFLGYQLGAAQQALLSGVDVAGHGTRRLPTEHWRALPVAIPPQDEQQHIVDAVRDANRIATKATGGTQVLIECAKEYRTRLIADVVTGKLDVREAAANLPEADPITGGNRVDTIQSASHPHAIEHDMAKEAVP